MKKFIIFAMLLALAACGKKSPPPTTLCMHPFALGGIPFQLQPGDIMYRDGSLEIHRDGNTYAYVGAFCVTVIEEKKQ